MDVIGFTDEEISQLNSNKTPQNNSKTLPKSRKTANHTSGQKNDRAPRTASNHVKPIGTISGASLSRPVETVESSSNQNEIKTETPTLAITHASDSCECDEESRDNMTDVKTTAVLDPEHSEDVNPFKADNPIASDNHSPDNIQSPEQSQSSDQMYSPDQNQPEVKHVLQNETSSDVVLSKLEQLQIAQAKLEHDNNQKQQHLKETISEKFTKTSEQARLLRRLQEEVACVEREMSCDISILRDRIDQCNRRYHDACKRHEYAEQEYVAAKLDLRNCEDLKEGLEEHLFTIIKLNETKKSEKLEDLYNKLKSLNFE